MTARVRSLVALVLATGALMAGLAGPAAADPAGPTNYRTVITGMDPVVEGVAVKILGGDTYLFLDGGGHEVLLPGYDPQEQYLRWLPDGTVEVNTNSRTYHQNQSRYLGVVPSSGVGAEVLPEWEVVSTDGRFAWHDHRVHFMTENSLPPAIDPSLDEPQLAYVWPDPVVLFIDGDRVEVQGELQWFPDHSPALPIIAALMTIVAVLGLGRVQTTTAVRIATGGGVVLAGIVGIQENIGLEPGVQGVILSLILPVVAGIVALAAFAARDRGDAALALAALAGVPLIVWSVTHAAVLTAPVLPTGPDWFLRVVTGMAAGAGVGALLVSGQRLFATPVIDDDTEYAPTVV